MHQDSRHVRLVAALAVVPLFGLMVFIAVLDLFFHLGAIVDRVTCHLRARRLGFMRLQP